MLRGAFYRADNGRIVDMFQWAPTLGGECYEGIHRVFLELLIEFQWAPTLGGECYGREAVVELPDRPFQWAPTLGGECYCFGV